MDRNQRDRKIRFAVHLGLRFLVGGLFCAAGLIKLWTLAEFASTVGDFGIVWDGAVYPVSLFIVVIELVGGIGLMTCLRGALGVLALLVAVFIGALAYGLWLGLDIDCGCLGPAYHVPLYGQIMIDLGILVCFSVIAWSGKVNSAGPNTDES